jgi:ABC-type nitrate/sulfonate/bicarbonate transport system permease component
MKQWRNIFYRHPGFFGAAFCFAVWFIISKLGLVGPTLIASPLEVWRVLLDSASGKIIIEENVFIQTWATIGRVLSGWSISLLIGIAIGALVGLTSQTYKALEPVIEFFRSIPPIMAFPLFLVLFNYNEGAYISTIAFGCIPLVVLTVARGFQQVSVVRLELLTVFRSSWKIRILSQFMEVLPSCVLAARLSLSISIIVAIVSEMVFTPRDGKALGSLAKQAEIAFHTPVFIAAVIIIGTFGYTCNVVIRKFERRIGYSGNKSSS